MKSIAVICTEISQFSLYAHLLKYTCSVTYKYLKTKQGVSFVMAKSRDGSINHHLTFILKMNSNLHSAHKCKNTRENDDSFVFLTRIH